MTPVLPRFRSDLTVSEQRQIAPAWSPDGRWIAFQSDHDADEQWDLFLVDPRNGAVTNLTRTEDISEESPVWSPDSRTIAYAVKPRAAPNSEIHLRDMAGKASRALTRGTPPDWSYAPVAFVADIRGSATIEGDGKLAFLAELAAGTKLLLGTGATVAVIYAASGTEFTATGPGEFLVSEKDLHAEKGRPPARRAVAAAADPATISEIARTATASRRTRRTA